MATDRSVTAILVAGGRGARFGGSTPKQFQLLAGRPVLHHSLQAFEDSPEIAEVVVVLPEGWVEDLHRFPKVIATVSAGASRQASVGEGLIAVPQETATLVIHDAVRPMVSPRLVSRVIEAMAHPFDGVVCGLEVGEATKQVGTDGEVLGSISRRGLLAAQTPQAARRPALDDAFARALASGWECEDCSEMLLRAGYRVRYVEGDPMNIKITYPEHLELCRRLMEVRAGSGEERGP